MYKTLFIRSTLSANHGLFYNLCKHASQGYQKQTHVAGAFSISFSKIKAAIS